MIIIVDSGSTKADWVIVNQEGNPLIEKIRTKGLNPAILNEDTLRSHITESELLLKHRSQIKHLFFYGAGCGTENPKRLLTFVLQSIFDHAEITVEEDTLAAVRGTLNHEKEQAIVCILGTGSNCSYFNGSVLEQRVHSLGYMLMDDASGNHYGKLLIRDYYFKHMPEHLRTAFETRYNVDADSIKYNLYKLPNANAYLASFAEFMFDHKTESYIKELIKKGLCMFSENMILQYSDKLEQVVVHFAGSIAFHAKDEILEVAKIYNYQVGNIIQRPIDGLVNYHIQYLK